MQKKYFLSILLFLLTFNFSGQFNLFQSNQLQKNTQNHFLLFDVSVTSISKSLFRDSTRLNETENIKGDTQNILGIQPRIPKINLNHKRLTSKISHIINLPKPYLNFSTGLSPPHSFS